MIPRPALLAAVLALALMAATVVGSATAQTQTNPIPGIDIVVKKQPQGTALVAATTGPGGRFSGRFRMEPGSDYEVATACRARVVCPAHQLVSLTVNGRTVRPVSDRPQQRLDGRNGIGIYIIGAVVLGLREPTTVVIAGQIAEAPVADPRGPGRAAPRTNPGASAAPSN